MPCLILSDTNIDLLKFDRHTPTNNYLNTLIVNNFYPTVLLPTRITDHSCTLIDHIYYYEGQCSHKSVRVSSGNLFSDLSDHLPNFICLLKSVSKVNYNDRPFIRLFTPKN